jgi:threonine/homoserine/homoserine lactone efflux protein
LLGIAFATAFSGAVVPGSLLAVVVRETLRGGWTAGPVMMIGHALLEIMAIILLVTGLLRAAQAPRLRAAIGLIGGGVLLYLGWQTLSLSGEAGAAALTTAAQGSRAAGSWPGLIWLGVLMSMVNPYWWLWWATIGAAHSQWALGRGRAGVGFYFTGHILGDVVWYSAVSIALAAGRSLLSPAILRGIYLTCASLLAGMGIVFIGAALRRPQTLPES